MGQTLFKELTYWDIRWVIPAALVEAAQVLGGGDVEEGLRIIAERGEPWMRSLAEELLSNRGEREWILREFAEGATTDQTLVEIIVMEVLDDEDNI